MKKEVLVTFILILSLMFIFVIINLVINMKNENPNNIFVNNTVINFSSLTLKQKLAQMIIVYGDDESNIILIKLNVGGIFLDNQKSEEDYKGLINKYQNNSKIKLFVTTDLEGAWNPFYNFKDFPKFSDIENNKEAYNAGLNEGKALKEIGFNLNFAPVAEFFDKVYGGRTFNGTKGELEEKLTNYITGLQENIKGTCKHYPGEGMINNLHDKIDYENISEDDLELFQICFDENISAIMIGHQIVSGKLDSSKKPASVSSEIINSLKNFSGLIISDEINMKGLSDFYPSKLERYEQLINSGENIILDFKFSPSLLNELETLTKEGKISEEKINESVKKILIAKGYSIVQ